MGLVRQLLDLQDRGLIVPDMISSLPPCLIKLGEEAMNLNASACVKTETPDETYTRRVAMEWEHGAANWRDSPLLGASMREVIATAVQLYPFVNFTLDGGTWSSVTGVRVSAERSSFLDSLGRHEHARPFEWVWLEAGDTVRGYCERKRPGDVAFLTLAMWGLRTHEHGAAKLAELTREPARLNRSVVDDDSDPAPAPTAGPRLFAGNARQQELEQASRAEADRRGLESEGREALTTWADARTRKLSPRFGQLAWLASYTPAIDSSNPGDELEPGHAGPRGATGFELPLQQDTFVRLPCVPEKLGSRTLTDAVWGDLPVVEHACLCILHAGMRTGEHLFTKLLLVRSPPLLPHLPHPPPPPTPNHVRTSCAQPLLLEYPNGGAVYKAVNEHLNPVLKDLSMREIRSNPESDKVYATSMDGTQVERWLEDLHAGLIAEVPNETTLWGLKDSKSKFLQAVTKALKASDRAADYSQLLLAIPVMREWVTAMRLAMRMKPEQGDYDKVKRHLALYVANKMLRWPGSNTWYDNECLYAMGQLHEKWGSLRLVSQEGMESWQVRLRMADTPCPLISPCDPSKPLCPPRAPRDSHAAALAAQHWGRAPGAAPCPHTSPSPTPLTEKVERGATPLQLVRECWGDPEGSRASGASGEGCVPGEAQG